jgi:hypothetical protein
MKTLYVVPKDVYFQHQWHLHPSHYLDLKDNKILVSGEFQTVAHEKEFLQAGALAISHICPSVSMSQHREIAKALSHLDISEADSTHSAYQKLRRLHSLL